MKRLFQLAMILLLFCVAPACAQLATVTVTPGTRGTKIPTNFGGISIDFFDGQEFVPNPLYPQLIENLVFARQTFNLNIEGDEPQAQWTTPTSGQIGTYNTLYSTLAASNIPMQFTLPVTMCASATATTNATPAATAYIANAGPGWIGITLGNEPDGACSASGGYAGGYSSFLSNWNTFAADMRALSGGSALRFVGPSFGGQQTWVYTSSDLNSFVNGEGTKLIFASQHFYPQNGCPGSPTLALELAAAQAKPADFSISGGVWNYVANAHAAGVPFRISEMNDIDCSGVSGISDTFAAALWLPDALANLANVGTDGVNVFSDFEGNYDFLEFPSTSACTLNVTSGCILRPNYYGMMVFQELTQNSSNFVPCSVTSSSNVVCWATKDANGVVRVLILNKDQSGSGTVNITVPAMGLGYLKMLTSSGGVTAKTGITYCGQTFDGSTTGAITGTCTPTVVTPSSNVYSFSLTVTQAALLTIPPVSGVGSTGPPGWTQVLYSELFGSGNTPCPFGPEFSNEGCEAVFTSWTGGFIDTARNRHCFWGAGHADYSGNEIYCLDYTQVGLCTSALPCLSQISSQSPPNQCTVFPSAACTAINNTTTNVETLSDGRPNARHTYNESVYIPTTDSMFTTGGALNHGGGGTNNTWLLSMASVPQSCRALISPPGCSDTWTAGPQNGFGEAGEDFQSIWDSKNNLVWINNQAGLFSYNPATNVISGNLSSNVNESVHQTGVYDDYDQWFITVGADDANTGKGIGYVSIASPTGNRLITYPGVDASCVNALTSYPGAAWDPIGHVVVIYSGGGGTSGPSNVVTILNPRTWKCTTETYGHAVGVDYPLPATTDSTMLQVYGGHFAYIQGLDIFSACNAYQYNCWYLRRRRANAKDTH